MRSQMDTAQMDTAQMGTAQMGTAQMGTAQMGTAQMGTGTELQTHHAIHGIDLTRSQSPFANSAGMLCFTPYFRGYSL